MPSNILPFKAPIPTPRPDLLPDTAPVPTPRPIIDADIVAVEPTPAPVLAPVMAAGVTDADIMAVEPAAPGTITDADIAAVEPTGAAVAPMAAPEENSFLGNIFRGMGERVGDIAGGLVRTVGAGLEAFQDAGVRAAQRGQDRRPDFLRPITENERRALEATPEQIAAPSAIKQGFDQVARRLEATDFGYTPQTTWEDFKASPLRQAVPFILETGLVSAPDMAAALLTPGLYVGSLAGQMGQARATNDLREDATAGDILAALPSAAVMALMERFGAKGSLGLGETAVHGIKQVPKAAAKAAVKEGATEFGQESLQSATETAGTKKGFDLGETLEQGAAGAIVGAGMGGGLRTVTATGEGIARSASERPGNAPVPPRERMSPETITDEDVIVEQRPNVVPNTPPVSPEPAPAQGSVSEPESQPAATDPDPATDPDQTPTTAQPQPEPQPQPGTAEPQAAPGTTPGTAPGAVTPASRTERVVTPDGSLEVDTEFEVVDLDQLKAAEGQLQPRDRASRVGSDSQIRDIASKLDPERLLSSRESDRGSPIIDDENVVLSGNGRTAAIALAAEQFPERYAAYRQLIESLGYDTKGMRVPVLVRRAKNLTPDQKRAFAVQTLARADMELSPSERARVDQEHITTEMLNGFNSDLEGGVAAAGNGAFVREFMRRIPQSEHNALIDKDGMLTEAGQRRITAALFARAYGDKRLVERAVEQGADKSITNALQGAAAAWARMRDALARSGKEKEFDITDKLVEALQVVEQARSRGMTLDQFVAQQDAFRQIDQDTIDVARLFYNERGTRLAAWRDMRDRLNRYAEQAERLTQAGDDFFGGGPADGKQIVRSILAGMQRRGAAMAAAGVEQQSEPEPEPNPPAPAQAEPEPSPLAAKQPAPGGEGGELFAGSEVLSKGPKRGKKTAPASTGAEVSLLDLVDAGDVDPADPDYDLLQDASGDFGSRVASGTLTPGMEQVSFTNERSIYEEAFRAAGIDPDRGMLLPPARKMNVLKSLLESTFGVTVDLNVKGAKISPTDAVNQMLDAYRGVRYMLHALELPLDALGLGGKLTIALERFKGRYLGAYDPTTRTIHMPGRSNSFAHEWMHAVDHYLVDQLKPGGRYPLYSQEARNMGVDPSQDINAAFVNLINQMFYDQADLAARLLKLEQKANETIKAGPKKGQPTQAARTAQEQIDRLLAGNTRLPIKPSNFRRDSQNFSPPAAGYYGSAHEMLARAFEAWIAHKVEQLGGGNAFITKGEQAYLSDADARLRMTFPKDDERLRIFSAFEDLFHHIRTNAVLGVGPVAERPADTDIADPIRWNKLAADMDAGLLSAIKKEAFAVRNALRHAVAQPAEALKSAASELALNAGLVRDEQAAEKSARRLRDVLRYMFYSSAGVMNAIVKRNKGRGGEFLALITDKLKTDIGSGREQAVTYDEERERFALKYGNRVEAVLRANGFNKLRLTEEENDQARDLMFGKPVPNAPERVVKVAAELRRIYEEAYQYAQKKGLDYGYVTDKGYLQRVILTDKVQDDPDAFIKDAAQVYELVFDRTVAALTPEELPDAAIRLAYFVTPGQYQPRNGPYGAEIRAVVKAKRDLRRAEAEAEEKEAAAKAASKAASAAPNDPKAQAEAGRAQTAADKAKADADAARQALADATQSLLDVIRSPFAEKSATDWMHRIVAGRSNTYDSHGPLARFTKSRTLPGEADDILANWYKTDVLDLTLEYAHQVGAKAAYQSRFGNPSGTDRLDDVMRRQEVRLQLQHNPRRYNPKTPEGRLNILRDLANPRADNLLEIAIREAVAAGADGRDARRVRALTEALTGRRDAGALSDAVDAVSGWIYVFTYITLLPRALWTAVAEPVTVIMRTNDVKTAARTFAYYAQEAFRSSRTVKDRHVIASMIGLVSNQLNDQIMLNRLSGDFGHKVAGNVLLARFFRMNGLTQITNAQRRAVMAAGFYWMRDMAAQIKDPDVDAIKKDICRAELRDLGIPDQHMDAMVDWLTQSDTHPTIEEMQTPAGKIYGDAIARYVDQTIQNPRRADKPAEAASPIGRMVYSLTSYLYAFFRNVHLANWKRAARNYNIARTHGSSKAGAAVEAALPAVMSLGGGFLTLFLAQTLVSVVREAIFNPEQWEEKKKDGELAEWIGGLAFSRTGIFGPSDVVVQALTGLRYERDLSSLLVGPGVGMTTSHIQNIINGLPQMQPYDGGPGVGLRNNPRTNTAEHTAVKSLYRLAAAPAATMALSALPSAGPVGWATRYGLMALATSNAAATAAADAVVGEKDQRGGGGGGGNKNPFRADRKNPFER